MKRFAWLTDIHLNFLEAGACHAFLDSVSRLRVDGVLISGDIAEGHTLGTYLRMIDKRLTCPVYFVLGNHDYYFSSIAKVRRQVRDICRMSERLHWLSDGMVVPLNETTGLLGHDGWADGRIGGYFNSTVIMSDYLVIDELANVDSQNRYERLNALGDETAAFLRDHLPSALERFKQIILLTHVPPFREACWHEGEISSDDFLPHFTCQAAGEALIEIMQRYPERQLTVLCGHSHGEGIVQIASNLLVKSAGADYGSPRIQEIVTL
jgi:Icc protein